MTVLKIHSSVPPAAPLTFITVLLLRLVTVKPFEYICVSIRYNTTVLINNLYSSLFFKLYNPSFLGAVLGIVQLINPLGGKSLYKGGDWGVGVGSDITFQMLLCPLVWEKIDFHKEKDGVPFAFGECNIYHVIRPKVRAAQICLSRFVSIFN